MKRIPKAFSVLNHRITVEVVPEAKWKWKDWAYWESDKLRILVCQGKVSVVKHSFWHETVHVLMEFAGRPDLSKNEAFVDMVGGMLAQIMSSAEFK